MSVKFQITLPEGLRFAEMLAQLAQAPGVTRTLSGVAPAEVLRRVGELQSGIEQALGEGCLRLVSGVCGGIAAYFGVDSTIVRILYVCIVIASAGWALLLYILLVLLMPEDRPVVI